MGHTSGGEFLTRGHETGFCEATVAGGKVFGAHLGILGDVREYPMKDNLLTVLLEKGSVEGTYVATEEFVFTTIIGGNNCGM